MELSKLLTNGEGQTTEFKKSLNLRREALEALCAMVNADSARGVVVFGVDPNGTVCGVEPGNLDTAQRSLSQAIGSGFDPPLLAEIRAEEKEGKHILLLSAERLRTIPYHEYDGRAWIRQGSENRQLTLSEKDKLRKSRDRSFHTGPWKCDRCGSIAGQISFIKLSNRGVEKTYDCACGGQFWPCT